MCGGFNTIDPRIYVIKNIERVKIVDRLKDIDSNQLQVLWIRQGFVRYGVFYLPSIYVNFGHGL